MKAKLRIFQPDGSVRERAAEVTDRWECAACGQESRTAPCSSCSSMAVGRRLVRFLDEEEPPHPGSSAM